MAAKTKSKKPASVQKPPEIITPAVRALLEWAQTQGVVSGVDLQATPDKPTLGIGMFRPSTKDLAVMAASTNEGNYVVTHELIHALTGSKRRSATEKAAGDADKLSQADQKGVVLPRHWVQGALDNPLNTPIRVMDKPNRVKDMAKQTQNRRMGLFRESMDPKVWVDRSGIKPAGQAGSSEDYEEAHAYYFSDPYMQNVPLTERAKEAGMFLLDLGVPMQIVEGVVADLAKSTPRPGGPRWSGGGVELVNMLKNMDKRTEEPGSVSKHEAILQEMVR